MEAHEKGRRKFGRDRASASFYLCAFMVRVIKKKCGNASLHLYCKKWLLTPFFLDGSLLMK